MERQPSSVDDAASWVAEFLLRISCSEQEVGTAKDCILHEKIDREVLVDMSAEDIQNKMHLKFGDARKLEKDWPGFGRFLGIEEVQDAVKQQVCRLLLLSRFHSNSFRGTLSDLPSDRHCSTTTVLVAAKHSQLLIVPFPTVARSCASYCIFAGAAVV